jgi:ribosomal protein L37AE/L43A
MEKKLDKPKCPNCGRSNILYRIKTDDFVCRQCGHKWAKK